MYILKNLKKERLRMDFELIFIILSFVAIFLIHCGIQEDRAKWNMQNFKDVFGFQPDDKTKEHAVMVQKKVLELGRAASLASVDSYEKRLMVAESRTTKQDYKTAHQLEKEADHQFWIAREAAKFFEYSY